MQMTKNTIVLAALLGAVIVAPFALMEISNAPRNWSGFPYPLFAAMWLLAAAAALAAVPLIRAFRGGVGALAHPAALIAWAALFVAAGACWTLIAGDQMPCFLGTPNCD